MISSMSPHSSLWPGQKSFPFLCHLLELLCCPWLCVTPAVPVLANSHQAGAAPQGEMNIPIINREACRCPSVPPGANTQILRSACPFQPGFTSQPEPAFEEWRGLMAHTKSSRWPVSISAVHYANGNKVPASCLPLSLCWLMKTSPKQTLGAAEKCSHVVLENLPHLLTKTEI